MAAIPITGTKIFITAGEHDLTDNIVHLVLAKLPDAPAGAKGISLFVAPKFKVDRDGNVGERNALRCGSIEHKMGIKGSVTCVMNFDGAEGYLVGRPHKGLQAMFTMMNTARLGVGLQGIGLSERAYQNALKYARERLQSRSLSGLKNPDKPADPILVHPDVRRMLLSIKSPGGRQPPAGAARGHLDRRGPPRRRCWQRERAETLVSFLTPISKALPDRMGHREHLQRPAVLRRPRLHPRARHEAAGPRCAHHRRCHEGTTGIQALDLIGRKTAASQGAGLKLMLAEIEAFAKANEGNEALAEFIAPLRAKAQAWALARSGAMNSASASLPSLALAKASISASIGFVRALAGRGLAADQVERLDAGGAFMTAW